MPGEFIYQYAEVTTKIYLIEKGTAKVYSPIDMIGMGMSKEDIDCKLGKKEAEKIHSIKSITYNVFL